MVLKDRHNKAIITIILTFSQISSVHSSAVIFKISARIPFTKNLVSDPRK